MRAYLYILLVPLLTGSSCTGLQAQKAQVGVTVPVTITGGFLDTDRAKADDPSATSLYPGFRVLAKPQMKLGSHWYLYSAIQVRSTPFFYEDAYSAPIAGSIHRRCSSSWATPARGPIRRSASRSVSCRLPSALFPCDTMTWITLSSTSRCRTPICSFGRTAPARTLTV